MTYTVQIRPKRQITLPKAITDGLDLDIGDSLSMEITKDREIKLIPSQAAALNALKEIQRAFQESGISEKEFLDEIERDRYGSSAK